MSEKTYLRITERMALRAVGNTHPNPPVGALIVKNNVILSRGWTQQHGSPHAEIHAINKLKNKKILEGATLYCTLEPCSHIGKNPPCVDKIIKMKFAKVVISQLDRNPLVYQRSVKKLQKAGIKVVVKNFGIRTKELNRVFFNTINHGNPFVTLKIASTADGKIATESRKSKWITNSISRMKGHKLRSLNDCILVGKSTLEKDDPRLDCRIEGLNDRSPDLFILDRRLELKKNLKIFSIKNRNLYLFHSEKQYKNIIKSRNIRYINLNEKNNMLDINKVLKKIASLGYMRVLVEGGSKLTASLLKDNLVNEIYWFRASKIMGDNGLGAISPIGIHKINNMKNFKLISSTRNENDELTIYKKT